MSYFPSLAFLGGSVGMGEWVVLFVVILLVVGPKRMPEIARKIGRMMEMFRRASDEFKDQLMNMDKDSSSSDTDSSDSEESGGYQNPYPDASDYPGNEDQVENWDAHVQQESPGDDAPPAETVESAPPADSSDSQDKPSEHAS